MTPLELLFEAADAAGIPLPPSLAELYPGTFDIGDGSLYVNFVEALDGVVALPDVPRSNRIVADESEADLFVVALLRACADAVVVGSHTLVASPRNRWTAEAAYPDAAEAFADLRRSLGAPAEPDVMAISRLQTLESDVLGERLHVRSSAAEAIAELRGRGARRILCEGGPTLFGSLLVDGLVDELFVTLSPVLAGRGLSLVEGVELLPHTRVAGALAGVRRHGSHLFLHYTLGR